MRLGGTRGREEAVAAPTNREIAEAWAKANEGRDEAAMRRLAHPDYVCDWPQTSERIHGIDAFLEIDRRYPGGLPDTGVKRLSGTEDRYVLDNLMVPQDPARRPVGRRDRRSPTRTVRAGHSSRSRSCSTARCATRRSTSRPRLRRRVRADLTEKVARPSA